MAVQRRREANRRHAPNHRWSPLDELELQFQVFRLVADDDAEGLAELLEANKIDLTEAEFRLVSGVTGTQLILRALDQKDVTQRRVGALFLLLAGLFLLLAVALWFWESASGLLAGVCLLLALGCGLAAYPIALWFQRSPPHTRIFRFFSLVTDYLPQGLLTHSARFRQAARRSPLTTYYRSGHVVTPLHLACCLEAERVIRFLLQASPHFNLARRADSTGLRPFELPLTEPLQQIFTDWNWSRRRELLLSYRRPDTPELEAKRGSFGNRMCALPQPVFEHILGFL